MDTFRICPTNPLVIERKPDPPGAYWYFYMVTDSKPEARRILNVLRGIVAEPDPEQMSWLEAV
jgi:hypothetical protein